METLATDTLTDRQRRFVFEYLKDQNASAAAERAGYSARSRASQAGELMGMPAVRERIRIEMESLLAELRLSALDLMKERMRAAFFRAGKLFDSCGELLDPDEMEAEVRDVLVIHARMRKGAKELSYRSPNREPALRALERVHERLEKLNEAHYAAMDKLRGYPGQGGVPAGMWMGPDLNGTGLGPAGGGSLDAPPPAVEEEGGGRDEPPVSASPKEGGGQSHAPVAATQPDKNTEISQVFSGSGDGLADKPAEPAPDKPAKPSLLSKAIAALTPTRKEEPLPEVAPLPVRGKNNPGAPLIKRHDSDLMWGGKRKSTVPEPSPALLEHLARLKHEEANAHVKREMELRGGKIRPGEVRPVYPPGFNPPWMRDERPQFAIGAGEFYFSGEGPED